MACHPNIFLLILALFANIIIGTEFPPDHYPWRSPRRYGSSNSNYLMDSEFRELNRIYRPPSAAVSRTSSSMIDRIHDPSLRAQVISATNGDVLSLNATRDVSSNSRLIEYPTNQYGDIRFARDQFIKLRDVYSQMAKHADAAAMSLDIALDFKAKGVEAEVERDIKTSQGAMDLLDVLQSQESHLKRTLKAMYGS